MPRMADGHAHVDSTSPVYEVLEGLHKSIVNSMEEAHDGAYLVHKGEIFLQTRYHSRVKGYHFPRSFVKHTTTKILGDCQLDDRVAVLEDLFVC